VTGIDEYQKLSNYPPLERGRPWDYRTVKTDPGVKFMEKLPLKIFLDPCLKPNPQALADIIPL